MSENEYDTCPMPVVREVWEDEGKYQLEPDYAIGACGEPVYVLFTGTGSAYKITNDPDENPWQGADAKHPEISTWELRCSGNHVLLVTDCEDRSVPYSATLANDAYQSLVRLLDPVKP